jgi:hypothetical protein
MNGYNLTDKQKELLRKLIKYVEERKLREPIAPVGTDQGYFIPLRGGGSLEHQGDLIGDLDALCDAGLISARYGAKGTKFYNVKPAGYDAVDNNFGTPLIQESPVIAQPIKEQAETLPIAQIFLCYAQEDEEKVENLYQKLSDAGFKPWMAKKDILPGEMWKLSIQEAMRLSDFIVVCLSAISVSKRSFVQREIKDALDIWREKLESDIYLIPVRLENCEVPESLRDFQWVNLFEEDGWTRLVKAIQVGMERRTETPAKSVAEAEQLAHEQRPVLSLYTVASTESEVGKAEILAFVANRNQNEVTSAESAVVKVKQPRADSIKWDKSGNLFWASHDLMWTIDALLTGAPRETIGYGLRQSLHHIQALGFDGSPIESRLAKLKARAEETTDWTPSLRSSYATALASIKDAIGDLASANQPDFDPGPKK